MRDIPMTKKKLILAVEGAVSQSGDLNKDIESNILEQQKRLDQRFNNAAATLRQQPTGFTDSPENSSPAPQETFQKEIKSAVIENSTLFSKYGASRYEEVPLELIDDNPYNARSIYEPEKIAEMARQLEADGQLVPGIAVANGERRTLIAAHYRKRGLMLAGIPTMRLMVYDKMSDAALYTLSYKENTLRNKQSSIDDALAWKKALANGIFNSQENLATELGISPANISKTIRALELPEEALAVITQNPASYSMTILYELTLIAPLLDSEGLLSLIQDIHEKEISRRDIATLRQKIKNKEENKEIPPKPTMKSFELYGKSGKIGSIKESSDGRVSFEVTIEDPEAKEKLVAELRARFQEI